MENNNKIRELYNIYLELGHEVFEEKIKKPMELYLHASSNVISMNSLNTIIANSMENFKLGDVGFDENDIFSPPSTEEQIYFDDNMPPIYRHLHVISPLILGIYKDPLYSFPSIKLISLVIRIKLLIILLLS